MINNIQVGNLVNIQEGGLVTMRPFKVSDYIKLEIDPNYATPIGVSDELMLRLGFNKHKSIILDSYYINISKYAKKVYKVMSINIERHNQYIFLREENGDKPEDRLKDSIVSVFNSDFDGELYIHHVQNLYNLLLGKKLGL